MYVTWRVNGAREECARIGSHSVCFCGHGFNDHFREVLVKRGGAKNIKETACKNNSCRCGFFQYVPRRPEQLGLWWLPK